MMGEWSRHAEPLREPGVTVLVALSLHRVRERVPLITGKPLPSL